MIDIGLLELIDGDGVTIIEWPEKLDPLLPDRTIHVAIDGIGDEPRTITIRRPE
jgi:tRNA threonylcarbamoyladenosine biosynthesis protein TsaE